MFKILYRTFFILLVSGLVSVALYIFVSGSPDRMLALINQIGGLEGRGGFPRAAQQGILLASFQRELRIGVGSWLALLDMAKNIVTIGLITVMVALLRRSFVAVKSTLFHNSGRGH